VVEIRVPSFQVPESRTPPYHLLYEALAGGLPSRERPQDLNQPVLARFADFIFSLGVDVVEEHHAQVPAGAALPGVEEQGCAMGEDVGGGGVVAGLDVAGGDDAELLVGFVETALGDSGT